MANRVFDDRLGLIVIDPDRGVDRLPAIRAFAGGVIRDVFLPRTASLDHLAAVRDAGLYAHLWAAVDDLNAADYAARALDDIRRLSPGAYELNIELPSDPPLAGYIRSVVSLVRQRRPYYRLRINIAAYKAFGLPIDFLERDPNLYCCEQTYWGDMSRVSEGEALADMLAWGAPLTKCTLCYGAAATMPHTPDRVVGLGTFWTWSNGQIVRPLTRGVIFTDDLMHDVGLL